MFCHFMCFRSIYAYVNDLLFIYLLKLINKNTEIGLNTANDVRKTVKKKNPKIIFLTPSIKIFMKCVILI